MRTQQAETRGPGNITRDRLDWVGVTDLHADKRDGEGELDTAHRRSRRVVVVRAPAMATAVAAAMSVAAAETAAVAGVGSAAIATAVATRR